MALKFVDSLPEPVKRTRKPVQRHETQVVQTYTANMNLSITMRDGRLDSVTTWTTGLPESTRRTDTMPKTKMRRHGFLTE